MCTHAGLNQEVPLRVTFWLSIALLVAVIVVMPTNMARQYQVTAIPTIGVPEVAHPADLTVVADATLYVSRTNIAKSDLPCWRNMAATGDESGMGRSLPAADVVWSRSTKMAEGAAPQLTLSWWRHENLFSRSDKDDGVLKIS